MSQSGLPPHLRLMTGLPGFRRDGDGLVTTQDGLGLGLELPLQTALAPEGGSLTGAPDGRGFARDRKHRFPGRKNAARQAGVEGVACLTERWVLPSGGASLAERGGVLPSVEESCPEERRPSGAPGARGPTARRPSPVTPATCVLSPHLPLPSAHVPVRAHDCSHRWTVTGIPMSRCHSETLDRTYTTCRHIRSGDEPDMRPAHEARSATVNKRRDQATGLRQPVRVPPRTKCLGRTTRRSASTSDSGLACPAITRRGRVVVGRCERAGGAAARARTRNRPPSGRW
jgi:hypothetical protein